MKLVILDRDGVINETSERPIRTPVDWIPIPRSLQAIVALNRAGYRVAIVTNQSGLAKGTLSIDELNDVHQKMRLELDKVGGHIDAIFFCPHAMDENCECRKPNPGLLLQATERFYTSTGETLLIGDSLRDIEAAEICGIKPYLVLTGNGRQTQKKLRARKSPPVFSDLHAAVSSFL